MRPLKPQKRLFQELSIAPAEVQRTVGPPCGSKVKVRFRKGGLEENSSILKTLREFFRSTRSEHGHGAILLAAFATFTTRFSACDAMCMLVFAALLFAGLAYGDALLQQGRGVG
jgi:hypothetical protein